jgi:hypothetical protein
MNLFDTKWAGESINLIYRQYPKVGYELLFLHPTEEFSNQNQHPPELKK